MAGREGMRCSADRAPHCSPGLMPSSSDQPVYLGEDQKGWFVPIFSGLPQGRKSLWLARLGRDILRIKGTIGLATHHSMNGFFHVDSLPCPSPTGQDLQTKRFWGYLGKLLPTPVLYKVKYLCKCMK